MAVRSATNLLDIATLLSTPRLKVSGTDLTYNGKKVFLSGCNLAFNEYNYDFGNGVYTNTLETWIKEIADAGGNTVRVFLHTEGHNTPTYGDYGYVTGCDTTGDFENNVLRLLNVAKSHNVFVVLVMWNGAHAKRIGTDKQDHNFPLERPETNHLIWDDSKLDSYIENCLNPLITKIKGHPAIAAFEAINEPEGAVKVESSSQPCYDTSPIKDEGPNWTKQWIPMQKLLRFIGRQNQAVRAIDPGMLTTIGSWSQFAQNDVFSHSCNYYKDTCLNLAAGGPGAHIDFYQMHTYTHEGHWTSNAPFTKRASNYNLDKPLVIGECSSAASEITTLSAMFEYAYTKGYDGVWSWHYAATGQDTDTKSNQITALGQLKDRTEHGSVNFPFGTVPIEDPIKVSRPKEKSPFVVPSNPRYPTGIGAGNSQIMRNKQ